MPLFTWATVRSRYFNSVLEGQAALDGSRVPRLLRRFIQVNTPRIARCRGDEGISPTADKCDNLVSHGGCSFQGQVLEEGSYGGLNMEG